MHPVQALRLCTDHTARGVVELQLYPFMTTALEGVRGQRHAPAGIYPRERPGNHCTVGWVVPRAGLDRCGKSRPPMVLDLGPSNPWPVTTPTEIPGLIIKN